MSEHENFGVELRAYVARRMREGVSNEDALAGCINNLVHVAVAMDKRGTFKERKARFMMLCECAYTCYELIFKRGESEDSQSPLN